MCPGSSPSRLPLIFLAAREGARFQLAHAHGHGQAHAGLFCVCLLVCSLAYFNKNSSGDEIANVNFYDDIARISKY